MPKIDFKFEDTVFLIFIPIWRSIIFLVISVFSFCILDILSSFSLLTAILAFIVPIPITLVLLFTLYYAAISLNRGIDQINNKTFKFISNRIIPPIVFYLIGRFSLPVQEDDKFEYYLSIILSILITYCFDKLIKFLEKPKNNNN